jgi:hypothetical protein
LNPFFQEAIKKAEEERRVKHKKMEEEREHLRQNIRDKVTDFFFFFSRPPRGCETAGFTRVCEMNQAEQI